MRWLEAIKLQSGEMAGLERARFLLELLDQARGSVGQGGLRSVGLYRHGDVPGSFTLLLGWDSPSRSGASPEGSLLAATMTRSMRRFGLVHSSVWIECITHDDDNHLRADRAED